MNKHVVLAVIICLTTYNMAPVRRPDRKTRTSRPVTQPDHMVSPISFSTAFLLLLLFASWFKIWRDQTQISSRINVIFRTLEELKGIKEKVEATPRRFELDLIRRQVEDVAHQTKDLHAKVSNISHKPVDVEPLPFSLRPLSTWFPVRLYETTRGCKEFFSGKPEICIHNNRAHMRGAVSVTSSEEKKYFILGELPIGMRPSFTKVVLVPADGTAALLNIMESSGQLVLTLPVGMKEVKLVSFDSVNFDLGNESVIY